MAGAGIVFCCGDGLARNRAAIRITGRNDAADDEQGETGSLGHQLNCFILRVIVVDTLRVRAVVFMKV